MDAEDFSHSPPLFFVFPFDFRVILFRRKQLFQYPVAVFFLFDPLPEFGLAVSLVQFAAETELFPLYQNAFALEVPSAQQNEAAEEFAPDFGFLLRVLFGIQPFDFHGHFGG